MDRLLVGRSVGPLFCLCRNFLNRLDITFPYSYRSNLLYIIFFLFLPLKKWLKIGKQIYFQVFEKVCEKAAADVAPDVAPETLQTTANNNKASNNINNSNNNINISAMSEMEK